VCLYSVHSYEAFRTHVLSEISTTPDCGLSLFCHNTQIFLFRNPLLRSTTELRSL